MFSVFLLVIILLILSSLLAIVLADDLLLESKGQLVSWSLQDYSQNSNSNLTNYLEGHRSTSEFQIFCQPF